MSAADDLARMVRGKPTTFLGFWGVVVSHSTAPNRVTIHLNGGSTPITCLYDSAYTPTNGDTVYGRMTTGPHGPDYLVEGKTA